MNKYIKQISDRIFKNSELSDFKDSTVLITGANGLIGGFLSDFFVYLNDEHDFNCQLVLTSLSNNPKRLSDILYRNDVTYHSKDLTTNAWFFEKIDYCFYCAGYAQPGKFLSNPLNYLNWYKGEYEN